MHLVVADGLVDINTATEGLLPSDPMDAIALLDDVRRCLSDLESAPATPISEAILAPPVPRPSKILAAAGNYREHIEEDSTARLDDGFSEPNLFAKLPSSLIGANEPIVIPDNRKHVDWEAELVVAIGRRGHHIPENEAWSHVAGVMCGQDISDRDEQARGSKQFTMAKSFDSYSPVGPYLVTVDELNDRDDIEIGCYLNDELVQSGTTARLIFSIPALIAWASAIATLEPGDLFFTGTPAGVGAFRNPPVWLGEGDLLRTVIPGVGELANPVSRSVAFAADAGR
jgi:2-keto-4-pentenoate hydratase/2-oxohepta-3-ene-1,7-dioic acid hydratase in catechol pathway